MTESLSKKREADHPTSRPAPVLTGSRSGGGRASRSPPSIELMSGRELSLRFYAEVVRPTIDPVLGDTSYAAAMLGDG